MELPSRPRPIGRRDVLRLATLAPFAAVLATSCAPADSDAPDALEQLDRDARSDAALARSIADAHAELAEAATAIGSARSEHARALRKEINRERPPDPDEPRPRDPAPPTAPGSADEAAIALQDALGKAEASAGELIGSLPTYRAGLVGSIAASCASLREVLG